MRDHVPSHRVAWHSFSLQDASQALACANAFSYLLPDRVGDRVEHWPSHLQNARQFLRLLRFDTFRYVINCVFHSLPHARVRNNPISCRKVLKPLILLVFIIVTSFLAVANSHVVYPIYACVLPYRNSRDSFSETNAFSLSVEASIWSF